MSDLPAHSPPRPNVVGRLSLAVAAAGFVAVELTDRLWLGGGHDAGFGWTLVRAGFEAALIGGVADWFAVTALFHPVPSRRWGLPSLPHTNLVVKNRPKLTDALVDMVENHLLSPASLQARLQTFSASRLLLSQLESSAGRALVLDGLRSLVGRVAGELDAAKPREFLTALLREQIRAADLTSLVGRWLEARLEAGDTHVLWASVAETLADQADAGAFDDFIEEAVRGALVNYRAEAPLLKGLASRFFVNPEADAVRVRRALSRVMRDHAAQPDHPLNRRLDEAVGAYARRLLAGDEAAARSLRAVQERLADHADLDAVVGHMLGEVRDALTTRLDGRPDEIAALLEDVTARGLSRLEADAEAQAKLDEWARGALQALVGRYHSVIGATARTSLDQLDNDELVAELDGKVGSDLQYIRLNGAIVGALVGMTIAALRWWL